MKATGIVRRIDDLGRVVIPKEIRRTLRIREGDPLEIFVDREGEVILKKYSPFGDLGDYAREYAESLQSASGHIALVADRDVYLAVAGAPRKEFLDQRIGSAVEEAIRKKKEIVTARGEEPPGTLLADEEEPKYRTFAVVPVIAGGEAVGAVVLCHREDGKMTEAELKMARVAASFLGKKLSS